MPGALARGVRMASDFLMGLQLTGAAKPDSVANLEVRLPIVVIGGGLTAIDTATESLAYYPVQVEKFLARYEALAADSRRRLPCAPAGPRREAEGSRRSSCRMPAPSGRSAPRRRRRAANRISAPCSTPGAGATVVYRRRLIDAPSYMLNHEEVAKALEEGIRFAEMLAPSAVDTDRFGHAESDPPRRSRSSATTTGRGPTARSSGWRRGPS